MKLIVVVPAYNEADSIGEAVANLKSLQPQFKEDGIEFLVYVVDDGSIDATRTTAENAGADRVVKHKVNLGLGAAVRSGLRAAKEDEANLAVKFDADLQHDPADIKELIKPILNDEADLVYGNRFTRISYPMPFVRKAGNVVFTRLMRWLTKWPLRDSQPGIFAVNRSYLETFYMPGDYNYTQQILLDAFHKGMRFAHVDVSFTARRTGTSFVSLRYPFMVFPQIVEVLIGVKPLKVFGPIGFVFLAVGSIVALLNLSQWIGGEATKPIQNVNLVLGTGLFGLQTLFFGLLADLIVKINRR